MSRLQGSKKLTKTQLAEAAKLNADGVSLAKLCSRYNISDSYLSQQLKRQGFLVRRSQYTILTEIQLAEAAVLHANGLPLTKLCDRYGISDDCLGRQLKRQGFSILRYSEHRKDLSKEQLVEAAKLHASGEPLARLCDKYNMSSKCLARLLKRGGLQVMPANVFRKYPCNDQFFAAPWDELPSYWAGFITADGCIFIKSANSKYIRIAISVRDREHLEKFKACAQAGNPICYIYSEKTGKVRNKVVRGHGIVSITLASKKICDDLISNGIGPRKTSRERIPEAIPKEHVHHFIRGYIDGDGWYIGRPGCEAVGFCGGYSIVRQISRWINSNIPEAGRPAITQVNGMHRIQYAGGKQTRAIIKCLYKNCAIALERKTSIVNAILERHANRKSQSKYTLTINGETRALREWTDLTGVSYSTAYKRARRGILPEQVIRPPSAALARGNRLRRRV